MDASILTQASKLITIATFFGLMAFVFSTVPFLIGIISEFSQKGGNTDKSVYKALITAFSYHVIAVISVLVVYSGLEIFLKNVQDNFIRQRCMAEIFWAAKDKTLVFQNVNASVGDDNYQLNGAYSLLRTVYTIIETFYALLPIIVIVFSLYVGYSSLDKRRNEVSTYSMLLQLIGYVIVGLFFYIAWLTLADVAMFLPDNESLMSIKNNWWVNVLNL
jgi:ABC-type multidrug transport system fused ATPase/permease subunit